MQPQKSEDLKNRKKAEEKPVEEKKDRLKELRLRGRRLSDAIKRGLLSRWSQVAAVLTVLLLIFITLVFTYLYLVELKRIAETYQAVTRIRKFMVNFNDSFYDKTDIEAINGVVQIFDQMKDLNNKRAHVQEAISEVIERISDDWVPFSGDLYFFGERKTIHGDALAACEEESAFLAYIKNPEEEDFLEDEINRRIRGVNDSFWIGVAKVVGIWYMTVSDSFPYNTAHGFWAPFQSMSGSERMICIYIPKCTEKRKCWKYGNCDDKKKWICRWKGDRKLLDEQKP